MARPTRMIGNENIGEEIDPQSNELLETPEESVETQLVEVDRAAQDDVVDAVDSDQLDADVDQLVEHAENVEDSLDEGGLDPVAARATEIAVEDICNRWNFKRNKVGVENYGRSSDRMAATRLGLESIIDAAKQGLDAIVAWFKARMEQIKTIWRKYINVGKSIKARAEKLRKRVEALTGSPDMDETIEGSKVSQLVAASGDGSAFKRIIGVNAKSVEDIVGSFGTAIEISLNNADKVLESEITKTNSPQLESFNVFDDGKMAWNIGGSESKFKRHFPSGAGDMKVTFAYGGMILSYKMKTGSGDAPTSHIKWVKATPEGVENIELPPLTTDQMGDMLDAVIVVGANLEEYIKKFSKVERGFDKLKRTLDKKNQKADKNAGKKDVNTDGLKSDRAAIKVAKAEFENAQELDKIYREISRAYATGAMAYVVASFPAYKNED